MPFLQEFHNRVRELEREPERFADALRGKLLATIFYEASTRTRLSFEAAFQRLGGGILSVPDAMGQSSFKKGESLSDTMRVIGGYSDVVVLRHSADGASRLAARSARVPVINGGDGRLGHPTQSLVDLATLHREWGTLRDKTVGILGDVRHGRTARSLVWALAASGARVLPLPAPGFDWEADFEKRILSRFEYRVSQVSHPLFARWTGNPVARILEPRGARQGQLFLDDAPTLRHLDALYITRLQFERLDRKDFMGAYPALRPEDLDESLMESTLLLHPLPRREELPPVLDGDRRSLYFEQARMGPVVRQAIFLATLRPDRWALPGLRPMPAGREEEALDSCPNENCISNLEVFQPPAWRVINRPRAVFLCAFCDAHFPVTHVGCRSSKRLHPLHGPEVTKIHAENLQPFASRDAAAARGYS